MLLQNDDETIKTGSFTPLEPGYLSVLRIFGVIQSAVLIAIVIIAIAVINSENDRGLPYWALAIPTLALAFWLIWVSPARRFTAWGYHMEADELRIKRGVLTREETIVPLGRVQHIDVGQGAIERGCGVTYLALHTAGMAYNIVKLPGLTRETAEALRDDIRTHIRADLE